MGFHFVGRISELLAILRVIMARFPGIYAVDVTPGMLTEARVSLSRN